jgi:hypothetical protein
MLSCCEVPPMGFKRANMRIINKRVACSHQTQKRLEKQLPDTQPMMLIMVAMVTNFSASPRPKLFMLGTHLIASDIKLCVCKAHNNPA